MDTFSDGQRFFSVGGFLNRPPNGNLFVGFRSLEGPISANVLSASVSYTTSPKWISTFGTSVDLGPDGNIGQYFTLTRIGESMLLRMGLNVDASRGSVGASFAIEPRFWPKARSRQGDGAFVLPQGTYNPE
jgi:hypothetical protein